IYVDEIDKIAGSIGRQGLDVSRAGVQRALLKPMEETEVDLKVSHDMISQIEAMEHYRATGKREKRIVNTKNILFIMSGAFDGLAEIVGKRLHHQTIGFEGSILSQSKVASQLDAVKAEDLVQFGFEREFIGRLPVCAVLEELTVADLQEILLNPNCALINAKKLDFLVYGIRLSFNPDIFGQVAEKALCEKTGARGLVGVVENLLLPFERTLPSTDIKYLVVDEAILVDPEAELQSLLKDPNCRRRHEEGYAILKESETQRLIAFLTIKKSVSLAQRGVEMTPERLKLMAAKIVDEPCDADMVCDLFVSLVDHIRGWQKILGDRCQATITFDETAIDYILTRSPQTMENIDGMCQPLLRFLEYGLRLIRQKQSAAELIISAAGVADPEKFINELVEKTYRV
ncbi:MAG: AAA family ATPase, partial [Desulfobulbaceae bacterium]|nr:AAA family ATPase [Desulfobulbaceae bacterium]